MKTIWKKEKQDLEELHRKKLEEIDEKIRKMITAKNNEINKLNSEIQAQQLQYKELEDTLKELNQNIASIR